MRWVPAVLAAVLVAVPAYVVPAAPPAPRTVDELAADLGHPVYSVREKAQRELWQRGDAAIPALEKVAKGDDPEAARRAREVLDKLAWGVRTDTPPAVLKLLRQYRVGDANPTRTQAVREEAIAALLKHGRVGITVVRAILKKDLPAESRDKLVTQITTFIRREVPLLLIADKTADADELMTVHAAGTTPDGAADYAAYHALRGDMPAATAAAVAAGHKTPAARLVLVHLYRAAGLWDKARTAAADLPADAGEASFEEALLEDAGDWKALADVPPGRELNHPDAVRLTLLRRAGRDAKFDAAAKKVRADADEFSEPTDVMDAAVALLANHRADAATDLLLEKRKNLALLSEILIARMRYKEALDLIGTGEKEKEVIAATDRLDFDLRRARVLMMTGRRDAAVQLFTAVFRGLHAREGVRSSFDRSERSLIRTELRLGLRDLACEHASSFIQPDANGEFVATSNGESPVELLFPNDPVAADALFVVLRSAKVPGPAAGAIMLRTRDLLNGTAGPAAVDQAAKVLRGAITPLANDGPQRLTKARRYFALATVCRAAKRGADAEAAYKAAADLTANSTGAAAASGARSWVYGAPDPARVWIEWGEFLADAGRHRDAATVFEAGWKLFPDQPLPLFLNGQALINAGDRTEGERRIELAHWVSLGNEKVRGRFLDALVRRGEGRAIKREVALILKACWSHDHFFGNVMNQCARGAALIGDFATAETCCQRSLLVVLRNSGVYFVDTGAYLNVPLDLLMFHAQAQLAAGKLDDAMVAARRVLATAPGDLELIVDMVPELDRRGHKKEADELFNSAWGAYQKMLKDYPASPAARQALAVLAGRCNRKLDDGLKYAKEVVAMDTGATAYRAALAEVHFRRGERAAAVKLMEALRDEQPRNPLYRRQLARYRTAAFDSRWPQTVE